MQANYGVGAKITAGVRNPAGLEYVSVTAGGEPRTVTFWKDEVAGIYGLQQVEFDDGTFGYVSAIADDYVPELIQKHGTAVTLWGTTEGDNTYLETARESAYPTHHLTRYLNTRYFELDPRIRVRVREFSKLERPDNLDAIQTNGPGRSAAPREWHAPLPRPVRAGKRDGRPR